MSGCIMFKMAPLECEEEMSILFDDICVTNATTFVPGGNENASAQAEDGNRQQEADDVEKDDDESDDIPSPIVGKRSAEKRPTAHGASPKAKKGKKTYREGSV
jgi:hypothetical protein